MKQTLTDYFEGVGLADSRFVNVRDGEKGCFDHDSRWSDAEEVPGENYGIYSDEDDQLLVLDVDYHIEGSDGLSPVAMGALSGLPATLKLKSPHVPGDDDRGGHEVLKLTGDRTPSELFEETFGAKNPVPSWGEVISKNKYIVGAGSQLDTCDKEWHDCSAEGEGHYSIKKDRPIATVDPDTLIEALDADPDLERVDEEASANVGGFAGDDKVSQTASDDDRDYDELDRETVEEMLEALPGDQHFDDWIKTGYAVYDWDSAEEGKEVFEDWSKTNEDWERKDSQRQIDYIWKKGQSGDADNKASVGTLVHLAKENGWDGFETRKQTTNTAPEPDGEVTWEYVRNLFIDGDVDDKRARRYAAIALTDRHEYLYVDTDDRLLKYHDGDGVFEPGGERHVRKELARELGMQFSTHDRNEVLATVQDLSAVDVTTLNAEEYEEKLICLENGVLNIETKELNDHDPEYRFTQQIPVEYDPSADAPEVEEFLEDVTQSEDEQRTLVEMIGATLHPEYLKSKFLFLFGEGQNGKGVYFELINRLLGSENVEGRGLHELADNRFAKADLHGKLANIGGDIDDRKLQNVGTLKRLTSNTDPVTAERKFGQPFKFVNSTTLFFAANEPPAIDDMKRSMARRIVPIHMATEFVNDPDDDDPFQKQAIAKEELLANMTTDEELSGLLDMALDGMDRLRNSGDVSLDMTPMERLEFYQRFSDPIYRFATDCLDKEPDTSVEKADVYEVYKSFSRAEGHGVRHDNVFWREFRRVFHFEETRTRNEDGDVGPRELVDARFSAKGLKYAPDHIAEKYDKPKEETPEEAEEDGSNPTLNDLEPGRHTVEVTLAEQLEPKPWQQGRGHVVDDGDIMTYVAEGDNPLADVDEGDRVRISNAKVATDRDGVKQIEVSGVCDVQRHRQAGDDQSAIDDAGVEADGGQAPAEPDTDTPVPDDAADANADARRLAKWVDDSKKELPEGRLVAIATDRLEDTDPDRAKALIQKATSEGLLVDTGDGYKGAL